MPFWASISSHTGSSAGSKPCAQNAPSVRNSGPSLNHVQPINAIDIWVIPRWVWLHCYDCHILLLYIYIYHPWASISQEKDGFAKYPTFQSENPVFLWLHRRQLLTLGCWRVFTGYLPIFGYLWDFDRFAKQGFPPKAGLRCQHRFFSGFWAQKPGFCPATHFLSGYGSHRMICICFNVDIYAYRHDIIHVEAHVHHIWLAPLSPSRIWGKLGALHSAPRVELLALASPMVPIWHWEIHTR